MPLPADLAAIFERLAAAPARPLPELRAAVEAHVVRTERAFEANAFVDLGVARRVAATCLNLLGLAQYVAPARRAAIQAACAYFAQPHDGVDDFASVIGFDDDAAVVNHVARLVGRPDLVVEVE